MARDIENTDTALEKLLKALPAEVTGAYLAIRTLVDPTESGDERKLFFFALVILLISPLFMRLVLQIKNWFLILFLMVSFVIWSANIDINAVVTNQVELQSYLPTYLWYMTEPFVIKATLIVWALLLLPIVTLSGERTPE